MLRPIPPQPMTATVDPACTRAPLTTDPMPVITAQPSSAARSSGSSSGTFTTALRCTTICSAKAPSPVIGVTGTSPWRSLGVEPGGRVRDRRPSHSQVRPTMHSRQLPQNWDRQVTTRSPGANSVTLVPTASMTPAASWPSTAGTGVGSRPSMKCRSL